VLLPACASADVPPMCRRRRAAANARGSTVRVCARLQHREADVLYLDKRSFSLRVRAVDNTGATTAAPISLMAALIYADRTPLEPPEPNTPPPLVGNCSIACKVRRTPPLCGLCKPQRCSRLCRPPLAELVLTTQHMPHGRTRSQP
jgi:hypothetical protein